jgi:hypothetical protein
MLNNVAVWAFLKKPAGEDASPFVVLWAADIKLHKGAGFRCFFPWCSGFTCAQANDGIAHTQRTTGLQRQIAGEAVAFVEQADDSHAILHRCARFFTQ